MKNNHEMIHDDNPVEKQRGTDSVAPDKVTLLLECQDYYLAYPPKQPKKEIADYVESQGFLVPKRFKNLDDAIKS
jgi:hypothetical protein